MIDELRDFVPNVHFELIPIKDLVSNQEYQRNLSWSHVKKAVENFDLNQMYMAFQKGTQTAPHGGIMPPQAGISTARNGNSGCAGRRLTVAGHGGIMNPLLLMYKTGQRWRAT